MLRSYLKVALRTLRKYKTHTVINVVGLAVGLAVCLLIALFIRHEVSYDEFHDAERIFQVLRVHTREGGSSTTMAMTPVPLADALQETFPQIEHTVRLTERRGVVRQGETAFEEDILFAGRDFFRMFSFELVQGNPEATLDAPSNVVLTPAMARKYFGTTEAIGRQLSIRLGGTFHDFTVAGIVRPAPANSSIQYDVLVPFSKLSDFDRAQQSQSWRTLNPLVYVKLHRPEHVDELTAQFPAFVERYVPEDNAASTAFRLLPIAETHLTPEVSEQLEPTSNPLYAYILSGVALFMLLIACINFVTLAIGRSERRAREVGVRKTMGAGRGQVMAQFWGEALLLCGGALVLGIGLARAALPVFNQLVNRSLSLDAVLRPEMGLVLLGLLLVVGGLAGGYPAVVLSRFQPVTVLRGRGQGEGTSRFVQGLIVVQFVLSIGLIIGTIVMWQQLDLVRSKDLGFQKEHVVRMGVPFREGAERLQQLRSILADEPRVQHIAGSWNRLGGGEGVGFHTTPVTTGGKMIGAGEEGELRALKFSATPGVVDALGLTMIEGHSFGDMDARLGDDVVLVNRAFVDRMGWDEPIGRRISVYGVQEARIVGVVEDLHVQPLYHAVAPLVITVDSPITTLYVRLSPGAMNEALERVQTAWGQVAPDLPFSFTFLDEAVEQQYRADERWAQIVTYAAGFAIFIACLGLFGLASLAAQRRTKEIGIRKVLGASAESIVLLLSSDFLKLVGVGFVVAVPLAYWAAQRWLQNFAYRTEPGPWIFAGVGLGVAALALLTVSLQALRAATADPAKALRTE